MEDTGGLRGILTGALQSALDIALLRQLNTFEPQDDRVFTQTPGAPPTPAGVPVGGVSSFGVNSDFAMLAVVMVVGFVIFKSVN